jgi:serine/threonine-protein kinase
LIGQELGHYRITAKLGEGGMGQVYLAEDTKLGREVAIKVLPDSLASDPERLERFQREARTVAALKHPNIVTIYSVEEADGVHFLTMELIDGVAMDSLVAEGPLDLQRFLAIAIPLADALASAHSRGVIHRDLKPSNVMIDEDSGVQILDFGLAKQEEVADPSELTSLPTEALTQEGVVLGTIPYMSPEQAEGKQLDHRSDIFSLGVVLYELATGKRPFAGDTAASLVSSILRDDPVPVTEAHPGLPAELGRILSHCLAKQPDRRFQSALDVRNELDSLRTEVSTPASAPVPPPTRRVTERQWLFPVAATIVALVVILGWWATRDRGGTGSSAAPEIESLAVLPLANLSGDPDQDYFADGMTEALINDLSKISALKVISRTSTMRYKDSEKPLPEIAAELGVEGIVEGSVLRSGNRVRVTAQLIEAKNDRNVWAESYERALQDVLALQGEVARAIAREIEISVTPQEQSLLSEDRAVDPEAHEAYLKGRHSLNLLTRDGFEQAETFMLEAIEADPSYGRAHTGLAEVYLTEMFWGYLSPDRAIPLAEASMSTARQLDGETAELLVQQSSVARLARDWLPAERALQRALELNPGLARAHHYYANLLLALGRFDEAIDSAARAHELDPLAVDVGVDRALVLGIAGRHEEGALLLEEILEVHPKNLYAEWALGCIRSAQGRYQEAIDTLLARDVPTAGQNFVLGHTYGLAGETTKAQAVLDFLIERSERQYVPPVQIAIVLIGMSRTDEAFEWLERSLDYPSWQIELLQVDPLYDPIRADPRFEDLLRRMGFPE